MNTNLWHEFRQKAARIPQRIILADGDDPRVKQAAALAKKERLAEPTLLGSQETQALIAQHKDELLDQFMRLPKNKNLSTDEALKRLQDPLVLGCLVVKIGQADGFIGGATRTTADTVRAVFSIIGLAPQASTLFGFFFIEHRDIRPAELVLLADCAVIPDPSPKQLANIAIGSAAAFEFFTGHLPRVAFLSFSTQGSAEHPLVDKMRQALALAREKAPRLTMDGEWQADAAVDPFSAKIKGVGGSAMAGKANVLIVPDLNSGNIAYKLVQRLGGCRAVGPVLWGTALPANDLSRGCSAEDVVDMLALTSLQASRSPAHAR